MSAGARKSLGVRPAAQPRSASLAILASPEGYERKELSESGFMMKGFIVSKVMRVRIEEAYG